MSETSQENRGHQESSPAKGVVIPFPDKTLCTPEEIHDFLEKIKAGKRTTGREDVLNFEQFLKQFADAQGCITIELNGEKKAIPISEFSESNPDIQTALSEAIAANDNTPEQDIKEGNVVGDDSEREKNSPSSGPFRSTIIPSENAISATSTPEDITRLQEEQFVANLKKVSTPKELVDAIRNVPGGMIRLRSKHTMSGEQIAQNIQSEGDDRILILASNINHAGIQEAASRLLSIQQQKEETKDVIPEQSKKEDEEETPADSAGKGEDTSIKGENYFENYFDNVQSMNDLKDYIRRMGQESADGVLELEDAGGKTRIQSGELIGAISRFNLGEGKLEEVPGENIRRTLTRLNQKKSTSDEIKQAA